jgi:hypothetical protein
MVIQRSSFCGLFQTLKSQASARQIRKVFLALLFSLLAALFSLATAPAADQTVGQWEVFEMSLTARSAYANAYVDGLPASGQPLVQVTFSGVGGEAQGRRYTLAGFWDGGQTWKGCSRPRLSH